MRKPHLRAIGLSIALVFACGPAPRHNNGEQAGGPDGANANCTVTGMENTPAECSDGIDNNCNGLVDCADPSCSGVGSCPVCGMVEHPTGMPVDLPDGVGGNYCTTDADCGAVQPGPQHCFTIPGNAMKECRQSYVSKVHFSAFGPNQVMQQVSDIVSVCANVSHEWIRDLEIDLVAPSGQTLRLDQFLGQSCGTGICEVYLGNPTNTDGDCSTCTPEMGLQYCWKPTATNPPILTYANNSGTMQMWQSHDVLPAGDYQASDPWTTLVGAMLNGDWEIRVTDLWPIDKGVIHKWQIAFNPAIVQNCSGPVIQ